MNVRRDRVMSLYLGSVSYAHKGIAALMYTCVYNHSINILRSNLRVWQFYEYPPASSLHFANTPSQLPSSQDRRRRPGSLVWIWSGKDDALAKIATPINGAARRRRTRAMAYRRRRTATTTRLRRHQRQSAAHIPIIERSSGDSTVNQLHP